jgi:DnaK suppressor protein
MSTMSEAELLAAPADDYMSPRQLAFFRERLRAEEQALLEAVRETTGHLQENSDAAADWTDRASCEEEHTLELRVRDRERKLLAKIRAALQRIDNGSYGWCEESGEPIGIARLLARPTATLTLDAQVRREQRKRQFGD